MSEPFSSMMLLSALSVAALIIASEMGSPEDVSNNLWSAALTVLVLLALSSERALVYVNRDKKALKHISGLPGDTAPF